tara:strand:- start:295 stop:1488 length:1194 start_codon:yes stop_codon:yes gene_type:complete
MAEIKVTDSVNVIEVVQRGLKGNTGDSSLTANPTDVSASGNIRVDGYLSGSLGTVEVNGNLSSSGNITASGNISSTGTGSFGRLICTTISASTGQFDANTIFIGGESFSQGNITKLKAGKSLRDTKALSAKSYELADGRKISREFENRFNRWAPNLEFQEKEGADELLYNEVDQIPQTYIDFTDKEYRINMFGGRSHQKQTLTEIELASDYVAASTVKIKTPKTIFSSQHGEGTEVVISGSLTITGSNTLSNYGNFKNRLKDKHAFTVTTDPTATGGWREGISTPNTGSEPHLHFQLSGSGQAGIGLLNPQATLHVSASSANFDALYVEGTTTIKGFAGANGFGNPSTLTGNTVIPAGYNVVLWTTNNSPSLTVPVGTNYTVAAGANVKMVNMDTAF